MTRIYAKSIEKTDNYVEFVLFEQGQYSRPMAIISDLDAMCLLSAILDNITSWRLREIAEQVELQILQRNQTEPKAKEEN